MRIIYCLDIKNNKVVKGNNFLKLKIIDDPINLIKKNKNIDEIVLLDITANYSKKSISNNIIKKISNIINIPLSIGGGINSMKNIKKKYKLGADRIILNSYIYKNIKIIKKISKNYGSQSFIIAIDIKKEKNNFYTYKNSGFINSNFEIFDWVIIIKKMGCGEILITSIKKDGSCSGYENYILFYLKKYLKISIIISGGFGSLKDLFFPFKYCKIKNFLIANVFHNNYLNSNYLKLYIKKC